MSSTINSGSLKNTAQLGADHTINFSRPFSDPHAQRSTNEALRLYKARKCVESSHSMGRRFMGSSQRPRAEG